VKKSHVRNFSGKPPHILAVLADQNFPAVFKEKTVAGTTDGLTVQVVEAGGGDYFCMFQTFRQKNFRGAVDS
jgi:hypothetical protein